MGKFTGIFEQPNSNRSSLPPEPPQEVKSQPIEAAIEPPVTSPGPGRPKTGKSSNKKDFKSSTVYFRKRILSQAQNIIKEHVDTEQTLVVSEAEVSDLSDLINALLAEFISSHSAR